ncbi:stress protein [Rippkaea orientalis PCC 8801]|uniref:Stress protein n=1 Tax=Rippkaea orientalis (strain PCC 8801 / RF-1) TaxID=41431 RepID=B7JZ32_RIPO1|nr:TerD family protein [Rippkaea orientalis]ACK66109.1 stress protein [Rippkaea orientalis PCC 8801]
MAINLQKGQRISLKKEAPSLTKLMCGLGWDVAQKSGGLLGMFQGQANFDLDSSILCLNSNDKLSSKSDVVYYGNLRHKSGAITHLGDNLTGKGEGDDEQILVNLSDIPTTITKLVFVVSIYDCLSRHQDFSQVKNAFVRLVDLANKKEIARYSLSGTDYAGQTGMILAEVYRHEDEWKMAAIGEGIRVNDIQDIANQYF